MSLSKLESALVGDRTVKPPCHIQVTVGRKDPKRGFPIDKDRLFLMRFTPGSKTFQARGGKDYEAPIREPYPDVPQGITSVGGTIVHAEPGDAISAGLSAYLPDGKPANPAKRPWCSSPDGQTATRWDGRQWAEIACPFRSCPYFMQGSKGCKPQTSVVFALREDGAPGLLARWTTRSVYSFERVVSFRRSVAEMLEGLGLPQRWFGIPIRLTVREQVGQGTRFPVVDVTLDGDLQHALMGIHQLRARLRALMLDTPAPAALLDEAHPDADDETLTPRARVLSAPATLPRNCPSCGAEMRPVQGKTGLGWGCECGTLIGPDGTEHRR